MNILQALIIIVILFVPLGELLRIDLGNNIILKPLDVLTVITAITFFITRIIKRKKLPESMLTKPLIVFCAIALLSLFINSFNLTPSQSLAAFFYWVRFVSFASIYFVLLSFDKKFIKKIPLALFLSGFIILVLGFVQYFLYPNLRNLYYLGWDEHNYRMFSVFLDPNFAGAFFVLYFLFIIGWAHRNLEKKKRRNATMLLLVSLLTIAAVFLTYSRSTLLMLAAGSITYLTLIGRKKFLLAFLGSFAVIIILLIPTFTTENTNLFRTASSFARFETYNNSIKIIKEHPIFGIGFNAYRYAQKSYGFRSDKTKYPTHADAGVDNSFLFVAATTGIVGLVAYLHLWYSILKRAFSIYYKNKNIFALIVVCSSSGLFIDSFFINSLFFPALMIWMWFVIGLMEEA